MSGVKHAVGLDGSRTRGRGDMVHTEDSDFTLLNCDVLEGLRSLEDESVHCVVTSPPYWGLRDYGAEGQLGLEPTPEAYVARMVEVFREVRRVLRADGTLWLNIGDSYNAYNGGAGPSSKLSRTQSEQRPALSTGYGLQCKTLKPKDLCGIPWRLAFALQADGWYLRADIIWAKPNPMPESVTDRPTKAHEYVFLLTKSPRYFFDQEAVREPSLRVGETIKGDYGERSLDSGVNGGWLKGGTVVAARNVRSVWEIATQPYPEAHFATYPEELVRRCILAGTSERGCCPECGTPWERRIMATAPDGRSAEMRGGKSYDENGEPLMGDNMIDHGVRGSWNSGGEVLRRETLGWRPGCTHGHPPVPCTVLDPFLGSGTTAHVARKHGRRSIGIELNADYCELAAKRMQQQSLFA